jgi:hypothetical protein
LEFGFVVSIANVTVIVFVNVTVNVIVVAVVLALVPASLQSSVYKPPAFVSGRLGVRK